VDADAAVQPSSTSSKTHKQSFREKRASKKGSSYLGRDFGEDNTLIIPRKHRLQTALVAIDLRPHFLLSLQRRADVLHNETRKQTNKQTRSHSEKGFAAATMQRLCYAAYRDRNNLAVSFRQRSPGLQAKVDVLALGNDKLARKLITLLATTHTRPQ
jgi:hypothetical protein